MKKPKPPELRQATTKYDKEWYSEIVPFGIPATVSMKQRKPHPYWVPPWDNKYEWDNNRVEEIAHLLKNNEPIYCVGPPATGKTTTCFQMASMLQWGVRLVRCTGNTTEKDLFGRWLLTEKGMAFMPGALAYAWIHGLWAIANEFDMLKPEVAVGLHDTVLTDEGQIVMAVKDPDTGEYKEEILNRHKNFRIACTANTIRGDNVERYAGAEAQNEATISRFPYIIHFDYLAPDMEARVLISKTDVEEETADAMVAVANICRMNQDLGFIFDLRMLLAWAKWFKRLGLARATRGAIFNKVNRVDALEVKKTIGGKLNRIIRIDQFDVEGE